MNIPGFDAAQARYDSMLPPEPEVFRCRESGESNEDCEWDHDCEPETFDDFDEEPPDFDDYKNGTGRYAEDYWLDD